MNVAYANGTLEVLGRLGLGLGGGLSVDPNGAPSPHSESVGSGYIARTRFNAQVGAGAGPLTLGADFTATSGNAVTTPVGGGFLGTNGTRAIEPSRAAGLRYGASVSAEIGSFTNGLFGTGK